MSPMPAVKITKRKSSISDTAVLQSGHLFYHHARSGSDDRHRAGGASAYRALIYLVAMAASISLCSSNSIRKAEYRKRKTGDRRPICAVAILNRSGNFRQPVAISAPQGLLFSVSCLLNTFFSGTSLRSPYPVL